MPAEPSSMSAGMEGHGYLEIANGGRPLLGEEEKLGIDSSLHSLGSGGKGGLGGIADGLVGIAAIGLDSSLQDLLVARVSSPHGGMGSRSQSLALPSISADRKVTVPVGRWCS